MEEEKVNSVPLNKPKTPFPLGKVAIENKFADIVLGSGLEVPWIERMDFTLNKPLEIANVHDDLQRESAFYEQALQAANDGYSRLTVLEVPHIRPDDYFAEMVKTDQHMKRVRAKLLHQKQSLEEQIEKRKQREMKKYGKQIQLQKIQERQKQKKEALETIKQWRKDKKQGIAGDDEFEVLLATEKNTGKGNKQRVSTKQTRMKREQKNERWGYGGKKRGLKRNDSLSTSDMSDFGKISRGKKVKPMTKKVGGAKKRPGKRRRLNSK